MSSLNRPLMTPWSKVIPSRLIFIFLGLSLVGFGIAVFLTREHLSGVLPPCSILDGCHTVLSSRYAQVGPVPTAAFGVVYYFSLMVLGVAYLDLQDKWLMEAASWLTVAGVITSIYLVYLQVVVIKAICPYCMTSALLCFLLFGLDLFIWRRYLVEPERHKKPDRHPEQPA